MLVGLVLVALVLLAAGSHRWGLPGALALAAASVLWLLVNGRAEGPILWTVTSQHGLTATDLAGLAGLVVAAWRGWQVWRSRSTRRSRPDRRGTSSLTPEGCAGPTGGRGAR